MLHHLTSTFISLLEHAKNSGLLTEHLVLQTEQLLLLTAAKLFHLHEYNHLQEVFCSNAILDLHKVFLIETEINCLVVVSCLRLELKFDLFEASLCGKMRGHNERVSEDLLGTTVLVIEPILSIF